MPSPGYVNPFNNSPRGPSRSPSANGQWNPFNQPSRSPSAIERNNNNKKKRASEKELAEIRNYMAQFLKPQPQKTENNKKNAISIKYNGMSINDNATLRKLQQRYRNKLRKKKSENELKGWRNWREGVIGESDANRYARRYRRKLEERDALMRRINRIFSKNSKKTIPKKTEPGRSSILKAASNAGSTVYKRMSNALSALKLDAPANHLNTTRSKNIEYLLTILQKSAVHNHIANENKNEVNRARRMLGIVLNNNLRLPFLGTTFVSATKPINMIPKLEKLLIKTRQEELNRARMARTFNWKQYVPGSLIRQPPAKNAQPVRKNSPPSSAWGAPNNFQKKGGLRGSAFASGVND